MQGEQAETKAGAAWRRTPAGSTFAPWQYRGNGLRSLVFIPTHSWEACESGVQGGEEPKPLLPLSSAALGGPRFEKQSHLAPERVCEHRAGSAAPSWRDLGCQLQNCESQGL